MRRRKADDEIQLLSTSFLDLLCCGLCSVVLLWVLTGTGQPARPDVPFGYVQIGQTGLWHWTSVTVAPVDGKATTSINRSASGEAFRRWEREVSDQFRLNVYVREGETNDFAGLLLISADRATADLDVIVDFDEVCTICDDLHVIQLLGQSGPRRIEDSVVHTDAAKLAEARLFPQLDARYQRCRGNILGDVGQQPRFEFAVRAGRLTYNPPAVTR